MTTFKLRALRALTLAGRRLLAGAEFEAGALDAAELIRNYQARLLDDAELGLLIDALNDDGRKLGRRAVHQRFARGP